MEEKRNNRAVEKKLNECLKNDRARIQVGRISPFGLLEMSRQRIRTGVLESSSMPCAALRRHRLRPLDPVGRPARAALHRGNADQECRATTSSSARGPRRRFYILNQKRVHLRELETRFGVAISIMADDSLLGTTNYAIERGEPALRIEHKAPATGVQIDTIPPADEIDDVDEAMEDEREDEAEATEETGAEARTDGERDEEGDGTGRRRRRRRRRRGRDRDGSGTDGDSEESVSAGDAEGEPSDENADRENVVVAEDGSAESEERSARRRRRGRRGGRGRGREEGGENLSDEAALSSEDIESSSSSEPAAEVRDAAPPRRERAPREEIRSVPIVEAITRSPEPAPEPEAAPAEPSAPEPEPVAIVLTPPDPDRPKRAGWWSKAKSVISGH